MLIKSLKILDAGNKNLKMTTFKA